MGNKSLMGGAFIDKIARVLNFDPRWVSSVHIVAEAGKPVQVHINSYSDERLMLYDWEQLTDYVADKDEIG